MSKIKFIPEITGILFVFIIGGMSLYRTIERNSPDYQAHPFATLFGSILPTLLTGLIFYFIIKKLLTKFSSSIKSMQREISKKATFSAIGISIALLAGYCGMLLGYQGVDSLKRDLTLRVPTPQGFIEASALSKNIERLAIAGQPDSVKLIGIYYEPDALSSLLNLGYAGTAPFCKALLQAEFSSAKKADEYLKRLVINAKKDATKKFDRENPEINRILKNYEDASKKLHPETKISAKGLTALGAIADIYDCLSSRMASS